jgi:DNA-binding LacI/PurR family transcriptional regulator
MGEVPVKRPTLADIASRAGVSLAAVSYALNGQSGVSEKTRRRVLEIADDIGWEANVAARALVGQRAGAVGMVQVRSLEPLNIEPRFALGLSGMEQVLTARSVALLFQVVGDATTQFEVCRRWWNGKRVDGVVVTDVLADDEHLADLAGLGMPTVVLGGPGAHRNLSYIYNDEAQTMRLAMRYLAALGHRRIGRICGTPDFHHVQLRDTAMREVAAELGLPEPTLAYTDYSNPSAAAATRAVLSAPDRPTAVMYDNDLMTVAGLGVAAEMGIAVPTELSLVAWDDSEICELVRPSLTALPWDVFRQGSVAMQQLLSVIDGGSPSNIELPSRTLVARGSTGPVPR